MRRLTVMVAAVLLTCGVGVVAVVALGEGGSSTETSPAATVEGSAQAGSGPVDGKVGSYDERVPLCGEKSSGFCVSGDAADDLNEALRIFDESGPAKSLDYLQAQLDSGPDWVEQCHQMIHIIGHEAAREYELNEVVAVDNRMCQDGYLDGAMEGFADFADEDEFWEGITTVCNPMVENGDGWKAASCAHSIGHAIAFRGVGNYREAVKYCDGVHKQLQEACGGGAIMGIVNPVEGSAVSDLGLPKYSTLDPEVIDKTCTGIALVYARPCLTIQWTMYPGEWDTETLLGRLLDVCPSTPAPEQCFDGYGNALYQKTLPGLEERGETAQEVYEAAAPLIQECYKVPKVGIGTCLAGVIYSAVWWYTTVRSNGDGYLSLCGAVRTEYRTGCERTEDTVLSGY